MKMLVVAATNMELAPFIEYLSSAEGKKNIASSVDVLITGVGITATTYTITRQLLTHQYDFALQAGVCGSFDKNIALGDVVMVEKERLGDTGAEDHDSFIDIFDMGLIEKDQFPFTDSYLVMKPSALHHHINLPKVSGITVSTVSGNSKTIHDRYSRYNSDVESMEGAAFHYVCLSESVSFAQVRAVSNYVTPRDKSAWKMGLAIANLNEWLIAFCKKMGEINRVR